MFISDLIQMRRFRFLHECDASAIQNFLVKKPCLRKMPHNLYNAVDKIPLVTSTIINYEHILFVNHFMLGIFCKIFMKEGSFIVYIFDAQTIRPGTAKYYFLWIHWGSTSLLLHVWTKTNVLTWNLLQFLLPNHNMAKFSFGIQPIPYSQP